MFLGMRVGIPMQGAGGLWSPYSPALAALLAEASSSGLVLDFTRNIAFRAGTQSTITGVSGWSYTRSGTAYDLAGTTSFAANVLRRTSAGLLVEAGATNLILQSNTFNNASWTTNNVTFAQNVVAPDGTTTAWTLTSNATGFPAGVTQTFTGTAVSHAFSVFARPGNTNWIRVASNDGVTARSTWFDLSTGTVGTTNAGQTGSIVAVGGGWFRCTIVATMTASASCQALFRVASADGVANANTGENVIAWGFQVETGSTASSYIPTTTTSASRGADAASVTGLTFSGAHSLIAITGANAAPATGQGVVQLDDGTNTNRSLIYAQSSNSRVFIEATTVQANQDIAVWQTAGARIAGRFQTNDVRGSQNGTLGAADTVATLPAGTLSRLLLGLEPGGARYLEGWLRLVAIVPRAINDTELGATA